MKLILSSQANLRFLHRFFSLKKFMLAKLSLSFVRLEYTWYLGIFLRHLIQLHYSVALLTFILGKTMYVIFMRAVRPCLSHSFLTVNYLFLRLSKCNIHISLILSLSVTICF